MPQTVTVESLLQAFDVIKQLQADGYAWCGGYSAAERQALTAILQERMVDAVDRQLDKAARLGTKDRQNR